MDINWQVFVWVFLANFCFIFLKAFQQLNVTKGHYLWVMPTSFLMATGEVYVVFKVAQQGWSLTTILSCGLGGGMGAICSMWIHNHLVGEGKWQILRRRMGLLKHRCTARLSLQ